MVIKDGNHDDYVKVCARANNPVWREIDLFRGRSWLINIILVGKQ